MVLTIDIGNTTIGIGGFQGNKLLFIEKISSRRPLSDAGYRKKLNMILNKHGLSAEAFEGSVISSVVPSVTAVFSSALEAFLGQKPLLLTHELDLGYEICTEFPEKVGCDRLADIAGAISRYPLPLITIDLGTATTFNVLDALFRWPDPSRRWNRPQGTFRQDRPAPERGHSYARPHHRCEYAGMHHRGNALGQRLCHRRTDPPYPDRVRAKSNGRCHRRVRNDRHSTL